MLGSAIGCAVLLGKLQRSRITQALGRRWLTVCGSCSLLRCVRGRRSPRRPPLRRKQQAHLTHPPRGTPSPARLVCPLPRRVLTSDDCRPVLPAHSSRPRHRPRPSSWAPRASSWPPSSFPSSLSSIFPPFPLCPASFPPHTPHSGLVWLYTVLPTINSRSRESGDFVCSSSSVGSCDLTARLSVRRLFMRPRPCLSCLFSGPNCCRTATRD